MRDFLPNSSKSFWWWSVECPFEETDAGRANLAHPLVDIVVIWLPFVLLADGRFRISFVTCPGAYRLSERRTRSWCGSGRRIGDGLVPAQIGRASCRERV